MNLACTIENLACTIDRLDVAAIIGVSQQKNYIISSIYLKPNGTCFWVETIHTVGPIHSEHGCSAVTVSLLSMNQKSIAEALRSAAGLGPRRLESGIGARIPPNGHRKPKHHHHTSSSWLEPTTNWRTRRLRFRPFLYFNQWHPSTSVPIHSFEMTT